MGPFVPARTIYGRHPLVSRASDRGVRPRSKMRQGSKAERVDRQVAKQGNVSEGYVHAAQRIKDKSPEIFEMVKAGTVSRDLNASRLYGAYRRSGARSLVKTGSRRKFSCFSSGGGRRPIQLRWQAIRIVPNPGGYRTWLFRRSGWRLGGRRVQAHKRVLSQEADGRD